MDLTNKTGVAFQLSEKSFRRYEPHIKTILANYPKQSTFSPDPLSPNTFAARLRDALRSLELYKWPTDIDYVKLKLTRNDFVVLINKNGQVVVAPKGQELEEVGAIVESKSLKFKTMDNIKLDELKSIITLLHYRRLEPIKITGPSMEEINLACAGFDVEFLEEKDGVILL